MAQSIFFCFFIFAIGMKDLPANICLCVLLRPYCFETVQKMKAYLLAILAEPAADYHSKKNGLSRFIDPYSDFGFKHIFGKAPNRHLLIKFLNSIFEGPKSTSSLL